MMRESTNLFLGVYGLPKVSISSIKENNMTFEEILYPLFYKVFQGVLMSEIN